MTDLIMIVCIMFSFYVLYLFINREDSIQKDVRNNYEKYKREFWIKDEK